MMTNQVEVIEKDGQPTHAVVPIKTGSIETLKKLSAALRIDIDDLVAAE